MKKIIDKLASKELSFGCITSQGVYLGARLEDNRPNTFSWPHYILGQKGITGQNYVAEILGHPVYKHHVEEEILRYVEKICFCSGDWLKEEQCACGSNPHSAQLWRLTTLWQPLGLSKSLQQIAECGYEVGCEYCNEGKGKALLNASDFHLEGDEPVEIEESCDECGGYERLKDPKARELEKFISNLIL